MSINPVYHSVFYINGNYPKKSLLGSSYIPMTPDRDYLNLISSSAYVFFENNKKYVVSVSDGGKKTFSKKDLFDIINELKDLVFESSISLNLPRERGQFAMQAFDDLKGSFADKIKNGIKIDCSLDLLDSLIREWVKKARKSVHQLTERGNFEYTSEDYKSLSSGSTQLTVLPLTCNNFAFYKLNDQWAKDYLFAPNELWPDALKSNPCQFFSEQGYEMVKTPTPGDLAVYCSATEGHLLSSHYAIWTENGMVIGKWGVYEVYEHPLDKVVYSYGQSVYSFHKNVTTMIQGEFLKEIVKSEQSLGLYTPLTTYGYGNKLFETFQNISISNVYPRSIYDFTYNLELKHRLTDQLFHRLKDVQDESPANLHADFRQLTLSISSLVKPHFYALYE